MLETEREKAEKLIKHGTARNLNLQGLVHVYKVEIDPGFQFNIHNPDFPKMIKMIKELYERLDEWQLSEAD